MRLLASLDLLVGTRRGPEGRGPVLKELLEPAIEDRGEDVMLLAQTGNRNPVDQVPAENRYPLLGGVMLAFVVHEPSPL
jgi:hypothetical protein